jgi:hypothetical protein
MPQTGDTKTVNGTTAIWDGMTWRHVDGPLPAVKNPAADLQQPNAHDMGLAQAFLDKPSVTDKPALFTDKTDPNKEHVSWSEDPARSFFEAAKGVRHGVAQAINPVAITKGLVGYGENGLDPTNALFGLPKALVKAPGALATLAQNPSLVTEIPGILNKNPGAEGELLGTAVAGERVPALAEAGLTHGPGVVGGTIRKAGELAEKAGTSKLAKKAQQYAPIEALTGHLPAAAASLVIPPALEYGGRAAQRVGSSIEGLNLSLRSRIAKAAQAAPEGQAMLTPEDAAARPRLGPARMSKEVPYNPGELSNQPPATDVSLRGLEQAITPDAGVPDTGMSTGNSPEAVQRGLAQLRSRTNNLKPNYMDEQVAGIAERANTMGRQSENSLALGYENVPEGGIRSTADIDALRRRPNTIEPNAFTGNPATQGLEASLAELRQKAGPQNPAFTEFGSTNDSPLPGEDGSYDLGDISEKPTITNEQLDKVAGDKEAIRNLFNNYFGSKVAGR